MPPTIEYKRLTRARNTELVGAITINRASLWLGPDHLLGVYSTGYSETYKRFYFKDIQAIIIITTSRRAVWNWCLGVPLVACLAVVLTAALGAPGTVDPVLGGIVMGLGVIFGLVLVINNLRGTACRVQLRTAVQTENLPSLARLKKARSVLDQIRPLIAAVQGQLTPAEMEIRMREWSNPVGNPAPTETSAASPEPPAADSDKPPSQQ